MSTPFASHPLQVRVQELERRIADHDAMVARLDRSEREKRAILNSMTEMVVLLDLDQRVVWANRSARQELGLNKDTIPGRRCHELWNPGGEPCPDCPVTRALRTAMPADAMVSRHGGGTWQVRGYPVADADGRIVGAIEIITDITERLRMETSVQASHRFLEIANTHREMRPLLNAFCAEIRHILDCEAVGVRILHKHGYIPYVAAIGFDRGFHELENPLCTESDACMCVHVIKGSQAEGLSFYSGGTFHRNRISEFLADLPEAESGRIRSACSIFGFESLALIPIYMGQQTLGLIHVADRRPDRIPDHQVRLLENTAMQLGSAVHRIQTEEKLWRSYVKLEDRVQERTLELTRANLRLRQEIDERKRTEQALKLNESRLETLYQLNQMDQSSLQEVCDFVVEQGVRLTQSEFGYLFFMNETETLLTVHAWSAKALTVCTVPDPRREYRVEETGLWGEAVRQRKPMITNDYPGSPFRRGIPRGHVPIGRHMNIPVFDGKKIVAVAGVANKETDYIQNDVVQLELLMKGMWRHIQRKRAHQDLLESEEKLRFLTTRLLNAQEKERKRVSNELHDELGQALLTLKLQLRAMERRITSVQPEVKTDFSLVFQHINIVTENVRRLSRELSPSILEDLGLVAAVHWLTKRIGKHHYIHITCDIDALNGRFDPEKELILFRIFQEALTNAAKHARTRTVRIRAEQLDRRFRITIQDGGRGFDVERALNHNAAERGLGLSAMDERVRMLGGDLDVWSQTGKGTLLTVTVPVPVPEVSAARAPGG